eukprot:8204772-Pyramimonas_sp.AAC.1
MGCAYVLMCVCVRSRACLCTDGQRQHPPNHNGRPKHDGQRHRSLVTQLLLRCASLLVPRPVRGGVVGQVCDARARRQQPELAEVSGAVTVACRGVKLYSYLNWQFSAPARPSLNK